MLIILSKIRKKGVYSSLQAKLETLFDGWTFREKSLFSDPTT